MDKNRFRPYLLGMIMILIFTTTPVFAEVTSIRTNSSLFYEGDQINFLGNVEEGTTGLVSIVIRDLNEEFVMLIQALINPDNSFEKTIKIGDQFSEYGIYNATGFILNMTKGVSTDFELSSNSIPIILKEEEIKNDVIKEPVISDQLPEKEIEVKKIIMPDIANFVDTSKDPQYYIDRYYNEVLYKSWFDKYYPELTIEEAVGYTENIVEVKSIVNELMEKEIIPEAEATSIVEPKQEITNSSEIMDISLTIIGAGILFGGVYGVKRKVDNNSKLITINRETIRRKFIRPIIGSNPKDILQIRLAKGEITLEEYEKIRLKFY